MTEHDPRPTLRDPDDDPHLWLEEIEGAEAVAWVDAESARTLAAFSGASFDRDRDDLLHIMDRPDKLPHGIRRGAWVYNFWLDADNPRGLWRRCPAPTYANEAPDWETVLDLDALAEDEGEDWVWMGAETLPGSHDRAMLRLSRGGGDAVVLREFDMEARAMVPDGFDLPESKCDSSWLDRNRLLITSALGDGMATTSGYARTVRLWQRGTPFDAAQVVFEVPEDHIACWVAVARTHPDRPVVFLDQKTFFDSALVLGDASGPKHRLALPDDCEKTTDGTTLALKLRSAWTAGGRDFAPDTVLAIDLAAFLGGSDRFDALFVPTTTHATQYAYWLGAGRLMVSTLDALKPVHTIWHREGTTWRAEPVTGLPEIGISHIRSFDSEIAESNGDMLAMVQDPLTPPSVMLIEPGKAPALLKRGPESFGTAGLAVSRHEAVSSDGARIPYVQVGPRDASGDTPVHLTAYGGFGIPVLPGYDGGIGKVWLERGGVHVTASIRGGGEFGTAWHDAGRLADKSKSHDDFAAVAADLVARGVTVPGRIAAEGGSNGGLLIANMLTRYPERFGALFCTIPLIDMRRYTRMLAGASWIAEYGDPEQPEDWEFIGNFSAYHAAEPGRSYPPILIATARKDDRVHPGHARKMTAKLRAMGYEAWLYEPADGGHGYGKDNAERATFMALGYAFLRNRIGWDA